MTSGHNGRPLVPWFRDRGIVRHLPPLFRGYAAYCRRVGDPETGAVRGGTLMHRVVSALTTVYGGPDTALVDVGGLKLAVDLGDLRVVEAIEEARRDLVELRILESALAAGDTFLDVGANHGSYAVRLAAVVGAAGRVIAFEPQPRLAALIRRSFAANGFDQGTVMQVACAAKTGVRPLFVPRAHSGSASLYHEFVGRRTGRPIQVETHPLDGLLAHEPLPGRVAIKLDVEGAEIAVLRGAARLLRERQPIVLCELNPSSLRAAGHSLADLVAVARELGYARYAELTSYPETMPIEALSDPRQRNIVLVPTPPSLR